MMPSPITQPQFPKQLRQKYIIENVIGEGAYGCVWKGENKITKKPVAIKGFFEIFKDHIDAKRILREVSILRQFPNNEHVIKLIDVICPDNIFEFEEFYIVLECCSYDLKTFIKRHEKNEEMLSLPVIRSILFQILCSLKFCKDQHIIHRDIKPANILIYESMDNPYIKLCDFGLAKDFHNFFQETHEKMNIEIPNSIENKYPVRIISSKPPLYQEHKQIIPKKVKIISTNQDKSKIAYFSNKFSFENRDAHHNHLSTIPLNRSLPLDSKNFQRKKSSKSLTKHLVTRWYRPPEIILLQEYDFKADIWSIGCVFAELLGLTHGAKSRGPLFPGKSCYPMSPVRKQMHTKDGQLNKSIILFDVDDQLNLIINLIGNPSEKDMEFVKNENTKNYLRNFGRVEPASFREIFPEASGEAINLLIHMLKFSPNERFDVEQCLSHTFFSGCQYISKPCESWVYLDYEKEKLHLSSYDIRALLLREVNYFNKIENFQQIFGFLITELTTE